jgi:hypothetical protein
MVPGRGEYSKGATVNVEKMRHQVRRAEAHALARPHDGPWTSTDLPHTAADINEAIRRMAVSVASLPTIKTDGLFRTPWW